MLRSSTKPNVLIVIDGRSPFTVEAPRGSATSAPGFEARCSSAELRRQEGAGEGVELHGRSPAASRPALILFRHALHVVRRRRRLDLLGGVPPGAGVNSEISCGVAVSKPTTSSNPPIRGSAIEEAIRDHADDDEPGVDLDARRVVLQRLGRMDRHPPRSPSRCRSRTRRPLAPAPASPAAHSRRARRYRYCLMMSSSRCRGLIASGGQTLLAESPRLSACDLPAALPGEEADRLLPRSAAPSQPSPARAPPRRRGGEPRDPAIAPASSSRRRRARGGASSRWA